METIENSVQKLRIQKKLTQQELADAVGVTRQTIIAIEKGSYIPSLLLALNIAKVFKKSVESIFEVCKN